MLKSLIEFELSPHEKGRGRGVAGAWQGRGRGVAGAWQGRGRGVAGAWQGRGRGVAGAWQGLNSKGLTRKIPTLFSRGLNSKYQTPVMYFELSPRRKWVRHGRDLGVVGLNSKGCGRGLTRRA